MSVIADKDTIRNGVDTEKMFATLDLIKEQPEIKGFYAAGGEDTTRTWVEFRSKPICALLVWAVLAMVVTPVALAGAAVNPQATAKASVKKQVKKLKQQVKQLQQQVDELARQPGLQGPQGAEGEQGPPGPSTGPAGGDLTGSYPNPLIGLNAVGSSEIADEAVGIDDIGRNAVGVSQIVDDNITSDKIASQCRQRLGDRGRCRQQLGDRVRRCQQRRDRQRQRVVGRSRWQRGPGSQPRAGVRGGGQRGARLAWNLPGGDCVVPRDQPVAQRWLRVAQRGRRRLVDHLLLADLRRGPEQDLGRGGQKRHRRGGQHDLRRGALPRGLRSIR